MQGVEAVALSRRYGMRYALRDASFQLPAGEITAVIGGNGAGKTTVFNILAGLAKPTSGSFHVRLDETKAATSRSSVLCGYLSHDSFLYGALTAIENLELVAKLHSVDDALVRPVLERVGLQKRGNARVSTFSRGMVQRLALGRLLLIQPGVWLLDEPATGLDEAGRKWLANEAVALAESGNVVAFASHHRDLVAQLATYAVVLSQGRVAHASKIESPSEIMTLFREHIG